MEGKWQFLTGIGVGIVVGMAVLPQLGKDKYLGAKAREGADYLGAAAQEVTAQASEIASRAKDQFMDALEAGKQVYREKRIS
jgi:hypothetical protein